LDFLLGRYDNIAFKKNYQKYGQGATEFYQTKCDQISRLYNTKGLILSDLMD
jgi:hypothetical protein